MIMIFINKIYLRQEHESEMVRRRLSRLIAIKVAKSRKLRSYHYCDTRIGDKLIRRAPHVQQCNNV